MRSIYSRIKELIQSPKLASALVLGSALSFMAVFVAMFVTGRVSAADGDTVYYYGLQLIEWVVVALMFIMLGLFVWMRHVYLFAAFIILLIVELVLHYFIITPAA
jgi:hypothetical protein